MASVRSGGYTIQYCSGTSCTPGTDTIEIQNGEITRYVLIGLTTGTTYKFQIKTTGDPSLLLTGVPSLIELDSTYTTTISEKTSLPSPENLAVTAQTDTSIDLQWDSVTDAVSYVVKYCDTSTPQVCAEISATTNSKSITGLNPNQPYTFSVVAKGSASEDDSADSSSLTTRTKLPRPTNFAVASKTSTSMRLEWTVAAGVSASGGYQIQYCSGTSCTPGSSATSLDIAISSGEMTNHIVTGLTSGTTYKFQIKTTGDPDLSDLALIPATAYLVELDSIYTQTISDTITLSAPTGLIETSKTSTSITLSWSPVTNASGYVIQHCNGATCTPNTEEPVSSGSTASKTLTGLLVNTRYVFQIKATHSTPAANSEYSSQVVVTTNVLPAPSGLRETAKTSTGITIEWDEVANASGYEIKYCDGTACDPLSASSQTITIPLGTTTTHTLTGLTSSTRYAFQIKAIHTTPAANSAYSSPVAVTTNALPAPSGLRETAKTSTGITIEWDEVANASGYKIQHCSGASCTPVTSSSNVDTTIALGTTTSQAFTGLIPGTRYVFHIQTTGATASSANSPYSGILAITTNALSTPTGLASTTKTSTSITLGWTAVTNASGYEIQYCDGTGCTPDGTETVTIPLGTTLTHQLTGLTASTVYVFQIKATHSTLSAHSPYSSTVEITTSA